MALIGRRYVSLEVRNRRQPRVGKKIPNPNKQHVGWQRFLPCWVLPAPGGPAGAERGHGELRDSGTALQAPIIRSILYAAPELPRHLPDRPIPGTPRSRELSSQTQQAPIAAAEHQPLPTNTGSLSHAEQRGSGPPLRGTRPSRPVSRPFSLGAALRRAGRSRAVRAGPALLPGLGARRRPGEHAARGPALPYCRRSLGSGWVRGWGKRRRPRVAGPGRGRAGRRTPPAATSLRCAALSPAPPCRSARPGAARSRSAPPSLPPAPSRVRPVSARLGRASGNARLRRSARWTSARVSSIQATSAQLHSVRRSLAWPVLVQLILDPCDSTGCSSVHFGSL